MVFHPLPTRNWSRAFSIWIDDIQVCFQPVVDLEQRIIRGGLLRRARAAARGSAGVVAVFFCLHCTKPRIPVTPSPDHGGAMEVGGTLYSEVGDASWYGGDEDGFEGRPTASGEVFDPSQMTGAHRTLPLGTYVQVDNLDNGKSQIIRINDRGPFIRGRILDVSREGARSLGFLGKGTAKVRIRAVTPDGQPLPIPSRADQEDPFTVQVAALSDPQNLDRLVRDLEASFEGVTVQETAAKGGRTVHRVRVGSFTRAQDAQKMAEEIARTFGDRGVEPFVTRRR